MEDTFQSSPNSVTKTQFRNKILRTLFLSHLIYRLKDAKIHLYTTSSLQFSCLEFGAEMCPGEGAEARRSVIGQRDTNELLTPATQLPSITSPAQRSKHQDPMHASLPRPS